MNITKGSVIVDELYQRMDCVDVDASDTQLQTVTVRWCNIDKSDFFCSRWFVVDVFDSNLTNSRFSKASLFSVRFTFSNLSGTTFDRSELFNVSFVGATGLDDNSFSSSVWFNNCVGDGKALVTLHLLPPESGLGPIHIWRASDTREVMVQIGCKKHPVRWWLSPDPEEYVKFAYGQKQRDFFHDFHSQYAPILRDLINARFGESF